MPFYICSFHYTTTPQRMALFSTDFDGVDENKLKVDSLYLAIVCIFTINKINGSFGVY